MEFLNLIVEFFNRLVDFFQTGIYDYTTEAYAQFVIWSTVSMIRFKIAMIGFAWDVAQQIIQQLSLSSYINQAFAQLDSVLFNFICFLRVPEFVNLVMSAFVTRYVLNFMGM